MSAYVRLSPAAQSSLLCRHEQSHLLAQSHLEAGMRESVNRLVGVVHGERDTLPLEIIHVHLGGLSAIRRGVDELQLSWAWRDKVCRAVLAISTAQAGQSGDLPGPRRHVDQ
jgi:hypothetical protein